MSERKKNTSKHKPVHVVRCGEVTAEICLRQSNAGFAYHDYLLTRSWCNRITGREAHGATFFAKNEQDLVRAVHEASDWLRKETYLPPATDTPEDPPAEVQ